MRRSLIISAAATVAITMAASSAMADLVYSFETLYDTTNNPNPAGTRPDDYISNGGGTTVTQSNVGVTNGSFSMEFQQTAAASFTGAITQVIPAVIDSTSTAAISFDLTIPATGNYTGAFARIGISEFGNNASQGAMGLQTQTIPSSECNIDIAPGTYHFTIPLIAIANQLTGNTDVPFSNCFGTDPDTQLTPSSFEFYINKGPDLPLNVYIDNVQTIGLSSTGTWANTSGGTWATPSFWSGGVVPGAALDTANFNNAITGDATINLNGNQMLSVLNFNSAHHYSLMSGTGGSLTLDAGGVNISTITDSGGTHTIGAPVIFDTNTTVTVNNAGDAINISGAISGGGGLTVAGAGTVDISGTNTYAGGTTVSSGVLVIGSALSLPSANSVVTIASGAKMKLATGIGGPTVQLPAIATGGTLDVNNDHMIINYGVTDPATTIYTLLQSGYSGGTWTGVGIDSSAAAVPANNHYGVGFVDGNDHVPGADSAPGVALTSGQILIAYALYGDVNLDGLVNATDFAIFGANFNKSITGWEHGDFTYTGLVNGTDFALLGENFGKSASGTAVDLPASDYAALDAFAAANGLSLTSVPEPASIGLAAMGAMGILARRRRQYS